MRVGQVPLKVLGTDEDGDVEITDADLCEPTLFVIGDETTGLSAGWREACGALVRIPMTGMASSLNAASAATVVLYGAARQRRAQVG
ncbi:TrmH family RNA methyltransferase [Ornithinimicrobium pratense]|uniref:TrmH family RNA methyltransferase n=1 Tax=Ornithinimicrobium pratense TaxID=2593973 RepID=UPI001EE1D834|nr:TrmH family RNA methyltransferase [Ornithinimicrobium pratense]